MTSIQETIIGVIAWCVVLVILVFAMPFLILIEWHTSKKPLKDILLHELNDIKTEFLEEPDHGD